MMPAWSPLGPPVVHPEEHIGPVAGLRPARARLDRKDGVVGVELARQEGGDLEPVELLPHGRHGLVQLLLVDLALGRRRPLDQLGHDAGVLHLPLERDHGQDGPLEHVQLRDVLLGALAVVPEPRFAHLGLHGLDLPALLVDVKETSTSGRRAS